MWQARPSQGFPYMVVSERWPMWTQSHPDPAPGLVLLLTFMPVGHSLSFVLIGRALPPGVPRKDEVTDVKNLE